ncbi:hemolysin family protein [uncultured Jatrophihabitans sp.]|uniref:hemolysin family protein n=1 Tax=uncultured Jatrophihabitans sp. TaxID=1610747 RepID=UPI0035CA7130
MTAALLLLAALALVVACGVFVAAEFALLAADRPTVERLAEQGNRGAKGTLVALRTLSTQLSGVQIGITVTNLAIGLLAEPALATLLESPLRGVGLSQGAVPSVSVAIGLVVSTLLTMLIGELLPKNLAIALPITVAGVVQAPVRLFTRSIAWPIRGLNALANGILHRFGMEPQEELSSARSAEELLAVVRRSAQQGGLETDTARLLARSLLFGRRRAVDVMTPRTRLETVGAADTLAEFVAAAARTGFSRYPVTGRDVDDIVGLVQVKAALSVPRAEWPRTNVAAVMVAPMLVPATLPLDDLLARLQEQAVAQAVVVDEYGGTDGIVTLEDLVEELVGEVDDEFDVPTRRSVVADGDSWLVPGEFGPQEVAFALRRPVPVGSWATVAGLFLDRFQNLPAVGDHVDIEDTRWTVVELEGRRIVLLRATPCVPADDERDADV